MSNDPRMDIDINVRKQGQGDRDAQQGLDDVKTAADQAQRGLDEVKDAAQEAQQGLDGIKKPDLDGVGDAAKAEAQKMREAGEEIKDSGEAAGMANRSYSDFTNTIFGLSQMRSNDITMQFRGMGNALQGLSRSAGLALGPLSAYAGALAAASAAVAIFVQKWKDESPEVLAEMQRLRDGADEMKKDFSDLSDVTVDFSGITESIKEVREAYAELRDEADKAFQQQERLAGAQDKLARAELSLERERALAAVPEEARPQVQRAFQEQERQLVQTQADQAIIRKRNQAEERLASLAEERAQIQERLKLLDDRLERAREREASLSERAAEDPIARAMRMGPAGPAGDSDALLRAGASSVVGGIERDQAQVSLEVRDEMKALENMLSSMETEIESLNTELLALSVSAQAVDISALREVSKAIGEFRPFFAAAQAAVGSARQSGDNHALQAAIKQFEDMQEVMKLLEGMDPAVRGAGDAIKDATDDANAAIKDAGESSADGLQKAGQDVTDAADGLQKAGQDVGDAGADVKRGAATAARDVDESAGVIGDAYRKCGDEVSAAASEAQPVIEQSGQQVSDGLRRAADVIEREAIEATGKVGGSLDRMATGIDRFGTRTIETIDLLNLRLNALEADLMRTAANTNLALAQLSNTR